MGSNRAGGTSSACASGNPPAVSYSVDDSYAPLVDELRRQGFADAGTGETAFLLERTTMSHME